MRFSTSLVLLSACAAPAIANIFNDQVPVVAADDDLKIPGESPLELCAGEHKEDLATIEQVDLLPNPPQAGAELLIKATGTIKEDIVEGAYMQLTVKYGLIRLISTKADFCDQIGKADLECPVKAGKIEVTKAVDIPAEIPPGKYTVQADVYTGDDVKITCLTATVAFHRGGFFSNEL